MKYLGPARIRLHGNRDVALTYVGRARNLLGGIIAMHSESHREVNNRRRVYDLPINDIYQLKGESFCARTIRTPEGVYITVRHNDVLPFIDITVPFIEGEEKAIEYRGLLRALQDEDDPCEPLREPEGEPGEEDFDPGEFSELHPLYDPNDPDQQWLEYPDEGLSVEHNAYPNYPLPPRGGTFIMDMIGLPFDQRAFQGKPPLSTCKMLVTGGGGTPDYEKWSGGSSLDINNWEYAGSITYNICPPRMFRIGRMDEMPGWPWLDTRDPEQQIARLVSISARMVHDNNRWGESDAEFLIEFLKLNGEPFESDEDGYLEPIEITLTETPPYWNDWWNGLEYPYWYDFSVISLTPRGNKAILAIHQAGWQWYRGVPFDFVVLDLEATGLDQVRYISRYENYQNEYLSCSQSTSGEIDNIARIIDDPSYDEQATSTLRWRRGKIEIGPAPIEGIEPFPTNGSQSLPSIFECTYAIVFDAEGELVRKFIRLEEGTSFSGTQSLETISGEEGQTLFPFLAGVRPYGAQPEYSVGDLCIPALNTFESVFSGYFVCTQAHTSAFALRPRLTSNGHADANPDYWLMIHGFLPYESRCWYARRNFTTVDSHLDLQPGQIGRPGGGVWMNTGTEIKRILPQVHAMAVIPDSSTESGWLESFSVLRQRLEITRTTTSPITITFRSRRLDAAGDEEVFFTMSGGYSWTREEKTERHNSPIRCDGTNGYGSLDFPLFHVVRRDYAFSDTSSKSLEFSDTSSESLEGISASGGSPPELPDFGPVLPLVETRQQSQLFLHPDRFDFWSCESGEGNGPAWVDGCNWQFQNWEFYMWPAYGNGVSFHLHVSAGTSVFHTNTYTHNTSNSQTKPRCIYTYHSDVVDTNVDIETTGSFWSRESANTMELDLVRAFTDPAPYVHGPSAPNDGFVLEMIIGPEKGVVCDTQQIAYVGWLYPQEMQSDD